MVGLTSFRLFNIPNESACYQWFCGDKSMWDLIGREALIEWSGDLSNLIMSFASGPFPLFKGREERISMSELHSYDPLSGLNSIEHSAPALFEQKRIVQIIYEKDYRFAQPPRMPTLSASAGDGKVVLTWDDAADTRTRDPFVGNINDFEGYKLYKATDKKLSDPLDITDGYGAPSIMKPVFQCDKIDSISGFAEFGHINGALYYLGTESGIVHHYVDTEVENGRTYYYALVAYDYGVEGLEISPSENNAVIDLDENENVRFTGQNVQIVTPHQQAAGYIPPSIELIDDEINDGIKQIAPEILSEQVLESNHTYRVNFEIDTIALIANYDKGIRFTTSGYVVYDVTDDNSLVYQETPETQNGTNIQYDDTLQSYYINTSKQITSDVFEGLRLKVNLPFKTANFDPVNSTWITGDAVMKITPTVNESSYFPWDYNIIFTENPAVYTGRVTNTSAIRDEFGTRRLTNLMSGENFYFYVVNTSFLDSSGSFEKMDLVAQDYNDNGQFDYLGDRIFVGPVTETGQWAGTAFIIDFLDLTEESQLPQADDVFQVTFNRPFFTTDSLVFSIKPEIALDVNKIKNTMENIRVIPNPYIATNAMEPAVGNIYLNQRRRIMFTNVPASCTVRIFTSSGILVDILEITNPADEGIVYWDLLSMEGLEVAAGMYFYHIKSDATGDEKMGKFAIIK
jgi:hypothetical protein